MRNTLSLINILMGLYNKWIAELWCFLLIYLLQEKTIPEISGQTYSQYKFQDSYVHYHTWTEWTNWSACSRSCGTGVRIRTRACKIRISSYSLSLPKMCLGETTEHELCGKKSCLQSDDFLAYQCSQHNGRILFGKVVEEWIPYHHLQKNPCELQCKAVSRKLLYSFGKVIDGTKCVVDKDMSAICVNGRCMKIDCAGQLGSDNKIDMCGVCRGDNSSCVHYQTSYGGRLRNKFLHTERSEHYDYEPITIIPEGATNIVIKEASNVNFLVLVDHSGIFLINGNWKIESPGEFKVSSAEFSYNRTSNGHEIIRIPGPLPFNIFVLVFGKGNVPTVHYEYWLPKSQKVLSKRNQMILFERLKSLINFNNINKNETESKAFSRKYLEDDQLHYKMDYQVPRSKGYKSFYHRNEILLSKPFKKNSFHFKSNLIVPYNSNITSQSKVVIFENTSNVPSPKLMSRSDQNLIKDKKHSQKGNKGIAIYKSNYNNKISSTLSTNSSKIYSNLYWHERPTGTMEFSQQPKRKVTYSTIRNKEISRHEKTKKRSDLENIKSLSLKTDYNIIKVSNGMKIKSNRKKRKSHKSQCPPCVRINHQRKNFCLSDFVIRATVATITMHPEEIQYELEIIQSYKNTIPMLQKEYVWTPSSCKCPRLKIKKEYILMGHSKPSLIRKRESRLIVDKNSFVRQYNRKRARNLQKLARDQNIICTKYL